MPLVVMVRPDVEKIRELINVWDHRCPTPAACTHGRGPVTKFARSLREPHRRHPQSFWNMRAGKLISEDFAAQIARALRVEVADITLPETAAPEPPRPHQAEAKAA